MVLLAAAGSAMRYAATNDPEAKMAILEPSSGVRGPDGRPDGPEGAQLHKTVILPLVSA